ncbi:MAG TPA: glycosyltransferase family 2 protein [Chloroflexi bacterium]|nr:glycosyltransferase family 2 protein [Chloroflexota bacterium]
MLPHLAIIIVSYNVRDLLRGCLRSVAAAAARTSDRLAVTTVVVDNASHDGSADMVAEEFPAARLIASQENLGFTGGNNAALRWLGFPTTEISDDAPQCGVNADTSASAPRPDYVLLLNPDAEVTGDALWQMVSFLASHPQAAVCGAGLRYGDGGFQHGAFRFPGVAQVALDLFPPVGIRGAHHLLNSRINGRYPAAWWAQGAPFAVDFVLGAAMMVRGAAIEQVGALDDGYWMYCEEMDWCRRFWQRGWTVNALPAAQIIHYEAQSSRQRRWLTQEQLWRSRLRYFTKFAADYPPGALWLIRRLVCAGMAQQARQAERRFAHGEIDGVELAQALSTTTAIARLYKG